MQIRNFQSNLFGSNGSRRVVHGTGNRPDFEVYDYPNGLTVRETAPRAGQPSSFVLGFKPGSAIIAGKGKNLQMRAMENLVSGLRRTAERQKIPVTFTTDENTAGFPVAYVNMKRDDVSTVLAEAQKTLDPQFILDLQSIHEGDDAGLMEALRAEIAGDYVVADESEPTTLIETEDIPF